MEDDRLDLDYEDWSDLEEKAPKKAKRSSPITMPSPSPPPATDSTRTPSEAKPDGSPDPSGSEQQTSVKSTDVKTSGVCWDSGP